MKKILIIALFATVGLMAEPTITTGSKKGSYFKYGHNIKTFTGGKVVKSKGSVENFNRLMKDEAQVAIAQKDAFAWYIAKHPEASSKIELLGDLKEECLYVVAKVDGKIDNDQDLQEKGVKVATGKIGSGSKVTWEYMGQLDSDFKDATSIPKGGSRALNKVITGDYDAYLSMQTPSTKNKLVSTVLSNKKLKFVPVTDWDLNDKLPSGDAVYTHEKIDLSSGMFGDSLKTICTTASVFISTELDDDVADTLADALLNNKNFILSTK